MRRLFPQTLPVWVLAVVITGLLVTQVTTLYLVARDRDYANDIADYYALNDRAFAVVQLMHSQSPGDRVAMASGLTHSEYAVTISARPVVTAPIAGSDELAEVEDIIVSRLARFGVTDARVRRDVGGLPLPDIEQLYDDDIGDVEADLLRIATGFAASGKITASIQFGDGQWLNLTEPITPTVPLLNRESLPLYIVVALLVVLTSTWAVRRLTAPYRLMENAVRRLGENLKSEPLPETGSSEIRAAARAFNSMQLKLREHVEEREQLAAALAHDLRTPMTRMRLRLSLMRKSPQRDQLAADLRDIEEIASSVVDFATSEVSEEKSERIDLTSLVESIADSTDGATFKRDAASVAPAICFARPVALRRCIANLVQNAIKYGRHADMHLESDSETLTLVIRDKGPGIPEEDIDRLFRPFVRGEQSRNRATGGHGLGLAIARNIARHANGEIALSNRPEGGLEARLRLPAPGHKDVAAQQYAVP